MSESDWSCWLDIIEELLDDMRKYGFAKETLENIYQWVDDNEHITEAQTIAITNIAKSKDPRWEPEC